MKTDIQTSLAPTALKPTQALRPGCARKTNRNSILLALCAWLALVASLNHTWAAPGPIGTDFTYQGQLSDTNGPVTGLYDFLVTAFLDPNGFVAVGQSPVLTIGVTNGLFTVPNLQLGDIFHGDRRWLQTKVRPVGTVDFNVLSPLQELTPTPYAIFAENAGSIGGVTPPPGGFWGTSGNNVSPDAKLGTTDAQPLIFIVNGHEAQRFEPTGDTPNVVGGFSGNSVGVGLYGATIGGGGSVLGWGNFPTQPNVINGNGYYATISGGYNNDVAGYGGVIGGGSVNLASGDFSFVAGGQFNTNTGKFAMIGGGYQNTNGGDYSTISGGYANTSGGLSTTIGGGYQNTTTGNEATVGGGWFNTSSALGATVAGGGVNSASGAYAIVPGGNANVASGVNSFAAGHRAKAQNKGSFVWADSQEQDEFSYRDDAVLFRCLHGAIFEDGTGNYVSWIPGAGNWVVVSDRNKKEHFSPVNPQAVLDKVVSLEVEEWNYKGYPQRHIGPMAQDFHKLFPLNDDDKTLDGLDLDGIELAAIKGLNRKLEDQRAALAAKEAQIDQLKQRLDQLEKLVRNSDDYASH